MGATHATSNPNSKERVTRHEADPAAQLGLLAPNGATSRADPALLPISPPECTSQLFFPCRATRT